MDFGLARRDGTGEQQLTHTGQLVGTPRYMAPEQVAGKPDAIGPGCDVYALGVILYELLTGRPPFSGDMLAVLSQIATAQPAPPSSRRPELDAELDLICLKAMAKQPRNRFGSMAEMAQSLSEYIRTSASQGAAADAKPPGEPASRDKPPEAAVPSVSGVKSPPPSLPPKQVPQRQVPSKPAQPPAAVPRIDTQPQRPSMQPVRQKSTPDTSAPAEKSLPGDDAPMPVPTPPPDPRFSLTFTNLPLTMIMKSPLLKSYQFEYDAAELESAGINLNQGIDANSEGQTIQEFVHDIFDEVGVVARFNGTTVTLTPKPKTGDGGSGGKTPGRGGGGTIPGRGGGKRPGGKFGGGGGGGFGGGGARKAAPKGADD